MKADLASADPKIRSAHRLQAALQKVFAIQAEDPDLAIAQLQVLTKQLPLLFAILCINAIALAATHLGVAPPSLTIVLPTILSLVCVYRGRFWARLDVSALDGPKAIARMRAVVLWVAVLGICYTVWSLDIYRYGGPYTRCHVSFFMSITVLSCILCLMHLRAAALLLAAVVGVPYSVFFLYTGNIVLIAMTFNFVLVAAVLIIVMLRNYEDFAGRILSQRETQRLSDENLRLANLDGLTGLPNRRRFLAELETVMNLARKDITGFGVAMLDLDRFKAVNDIYGHAAGDRLLEQIGARLNQLASDKLFIARLGGDEFGVILHDCPTEADVAAFGATVQKLLEPAFAIDSDAIATIGCSIGVAIFPQHGQSTADLFERADYALYDGKQHRRGETILFSQELETEIRKSSQIERALRHEDLQKELWLAFQPIMDMATGKAVAFEALARWHSHELGEVTPDIFIPIAERAQIINQVTEILFGKMLQAIREIPAPLRVCFNLSTIDLCSPATMTRLRTMILQSGVPPSRIIFEITEGALLQDFRRASEAIESLHQLGAGVSLDDFGAGFSSLGYVHRLQLNTLKIDRSFAAGIGHNKTTPKIIRSILDLCRNLDLDCVIEGVETAAQINQLLDLGARLVQGYYFGKPMHINCVADYLARGTQMEPRPMMPTPKLRRRHTLLLDK